MNRNCAKPNTQKLARAVAACEVKQQNISDLQFFLAMIRGNEQNTQVQTSNYSTIDNRCKTTTANMIEVRTATSSQVSRRQWRQSRVHRQRYPQVYRRNARATPDEVR